MRGIAVSGPTSLRLARGSLSRVRTGMPSKPNCEEGFVSPAKENKTNAEVSVGRTVHYTLTVQDADNINQLRADSAKTTALVQSQFGGLPGQKHVGNAVSAGEVYPMVVTKVLGEGLVNGQVLLDGNDQLWVNAAGEGAGEGNWAWPAIVGGTKGPKGEKGDTGDTGEHGEKGARGPAGKHG